MTEGTRSIRRAGPEALSLRELARKIGVSPRAPYRHFADKPALLAAIAEDGFRAFAASLEDAAAAARPSSRLHALAGAYIDFSLANPALVQLMFSDRFQDRSRRYPALHAAALHSFAVLEAEVGRRAPDATPRRRALAATAAWATVHGLSDLLRRSQLAHVLPDSTDHRRLRSFVVDLFLAGLAA